MNLTHPSVRLILDACKSEGLTANQTAYCLATAHHETGAFKYMREIWGPTDVQKRYEGRADLGNTQKGDGKKYLGRGFVQITGRRNYTDWSRRLGVDLIAKPQLAEQPKTAARILVEGMKLGTFTGKKLSDYITGSKADYRGARRIINGTDKADLIAGYAKAYEAELSANASKPVALADPKLLSTKRFWTWASTGGGTAILPFVDWRAQLLIIVVVVAFAIYAIATMPQVRKMLGLEQ